MKLLEAYHKLNNTFFMNEREDNIKYNMDRPENYQDQHNVKYDENNTDCKDSKEAIDALQLILGGINVLQIILTKNVDMNEFSLLIKQGQTLFDANILYNTNRPAGNCLTKDEFHQIYMYYIMNNERNCD